MHHRSTDLSGATGHRRDHALRPGGGSPAAGAGRNADPLVARLVEIQKAIESGTQAVTTAIRTAAVATAIGSAAAPSLSDDADSNAWNQGNAAWAPAGAMIAANDRAARIGDVAGPPLTSRSMQQGIGARSVGELSAPFSRRDEPSTDETNRRNDFRNKTTVNAPPSSANVHEAASAHRSTSDSANLRKRSLNQSVGIGKRRPEAARPKPDRLKDDSRDNRSHRMRAGSGRDENDGRQPEGRGGVTTLPIDRPESRAEITAGIRRSFDEQRRPGNPRPAPQIEGLKTQARHKPLRFAGSAVLTRRPAEDAQPRQTIDDPARAAARLLASHDVIRGKIKPGATEPIHPESDRFQRLLPKSKSAKPGSTISLPQDIDSRKDTFGAKKPKVASHDQATFRRHARAKPGDHRPKKPSAPQPKEPAKPSSGRGGPESRQGRPDEDPRARQDGDRLFAALKTIADTLLEIKAALAHGPRRSTSTGSQGPNPAGLNVGVAANRVAAVG